MPDIEETHVLIWIALSLALVIGCDSQMDSTQEPYITENTDSTASRQYLHQGRDRIVYGECREAIADLKKSIALNPYSYSNDAAYHWMGRAYGRLEQNSEAIRAYKKAVAIQPYNHTAYASYFYMGKTYEKLEKYPNAIAAYEKAIAINCLSGNEYYDVGDSYYYMGLAYRRLEQHADAIHAFRKAIAAYKKATEIEPDDTDVYYHMGLAYDELEQHANGIAAYEKFIELEPTGRRADSIRKRISELPTVQPATQPGDK